MTMSKQELIQHLQNFITQIDEMDRDTDKYMEELERLDNDSKLQSISKSIQNVPEYKLMRMPNFYHKGALSIVLQAYNIQVLYMLLYLKEIEKNKLQRACIKNLLTYLKEQ